MQKSHYSLLSEDETRGLEYLNQLNSISSSIDESIISPTIQVLREEERIDKLIDWCIKAVSKPSSMNDSQKAELLKFLVIEFSSLDSPMELKDIPCEEISKHGSMKKNPIEEDKFKNLIDNFDLSQMVSLSNQEFKALVLSFRYLFRHSKLVNQLREASLMLLDNSFHGETEKTPGNTQDRLNSLVENFNKFPIPQKVIDFFLEKTTYANTFNLYSRFAQDLASQKTQKYQLPIIMIDLNQEIYIDDPLTYDRLYDLPQEETSALEVSFPVTEDQLWSITQLKDYFHNTGDEEDIKKAQRSLLKLKNKESNSTQLSRIVAVSKRAVDKVQKFLEENKTPEAYTIATAALSLMKNTGTVQRKPSEALKIIDTYCSACLKSGLYQTAVDTLDEYIPQFPSDEYKVYLLRSKALIADQTGVLSEKEILTVYKELKNMSQSLNERNPQNKDYINMLIQSLIGSKKPKNAIDFIDRELNKFGSEDRAFLSKCKADIIVEYKFEDYPINPIYEDVVRFVDDAMQSGSNKEADLCIMKIHSLTNLERYQEALDFVDNCLEAIAMKEGEEGYYNLAYLKATIILNHLPDIELYKDACVQMYLTNPDRIFLPIISLALLQSRGDLEDDKYNELMSSFTQEYNNLLNVQSEEEFIEVHREFLLTDKINTKNKEYKTALIFKESLENLIKKFLDCGFIQVKDNGEVFSQIFEGKTYTILKKDNGIEINVDENLTQ
ncbi:MAG: hypothetical protein QNJ31_03730 [Candidatus Caenarcaniphilales bacterium]|nr:hypothetical protein [Candidatus Caenarcaniphilales bacterium]